MTSPADTARVWLAATDVLDEPTLVEEYVGLLEPDERAAWGRFRRPALRARYALGHALVRCALSDAADTPPAAWRFSRTEGGRPAVDLPADQRHLRFSLSYTERLVVCAVVANTDIGIDVEHCARHIDPGVAHRVLHADELEAWGSLPDAQGKRWFFRSWTLKEAYSKAVGQGLGIPFASISFGREPTDRITCDLSACSDAASNWQFALYEPTAEHVLALAVRGARPARPVVVSRVVPLRAPPRVIALPPVAATPVPVFG